MTTNVFIVDDSATARTALKLILESSDDINVIGVASTPPIALKRMQKNWPDVIISDIEMPDMDGFEFLQYLQKNRPTPFIVFSNYTGSSAKSSVEALSRGAVDIIPKPNFNDASSLSRATQSILLAVRAAANAKGVGKTAVEEDVEEQANAEPATLPADKNSFSIIAVGSSTGGTSIIEKLLTAMSTDCPGIVVVQHMPEGFTRAFADRVNQFCKIKVKEAEDGDEVKPGMALIAPGGRHMKLVGRPGHYRVSVFDADYVNRHRPSVDVLFSSVAVASGRNALGIILTGMGKDGAKGLLDMKKAGAYTIGQAEEDCAVYGMPKAAVALGAVDEEMRVKQIIKAASSIHLKK